MRMRKAGEYAEYEEELRSGFRACLDIPENRARIAAIERIKVRTHDTKQPD